MGNVIALSDSSATLVSTFRYTPFGQLAIHTGTVLSRHLLSSKEFDSSVKLFYYGYRYYSPRLGRWITPDPMGEIGFSHIYSRFSGLSPSHQQPSRFRSWPIGSPLGDFASYIQRHSEEKYHAYRSFLNNSLYWSDFWGLSIMPPVAFVQVPSSLLPCPDYCCDCDFAAVNALIENQKKVIQQLKQLIADQGDFSPFNKEDRKKMLQWANVGGGRSEEYYTACACIRYATDFLETDYLRFFVDILRIRFSGYAQMEIGRSETFINILEEVKRQCSECRSRQA